LCKSFITCWNHFVDEDSDENPKLSKEAKIYWSINPKTKGGNKISHEVEFVVDANFGVPGAIIVTNKYKKEFYLESIVAIEGLVYLPNDTPVGLKRLREKELKQLRGNSDDSRTTSDRIYDYDVYNDLGNPDKGDEFVRPILGNQSQPYPRRCRSKRPPTNSDVNVESPVSKYMPKYVPRDEAFGDLKAKAITEGKWKAMLRSLVPTLKQKVAINGEAIKSFSDITELYKESLPPFEEGGDECWEKGGLPKLLNKMIKECGQDVFKFDSPKLISRDIPSCCLRDDELGRLTLAGMNPLSIERLKVFPPVSNLDPSIYGPQDSALKEEQIICHLNGMSVQQAIEENKLFILDYHDVYLPFLDRINAHPTKKAYATRTIFVLTDMGSLKPIAIELSLPEKNRNGPPKCVVTPPVDATTCWLWQLGKAHVCSNDAGAHQLIHHWLRTHACLEPFIIAAHRQLSVMHPIYKLLHCHMRYTMDVNAQGRQLLLNAGGIIESHFFTAACSMEVSASVYQNWWRFDMESLPADLIRSWWPKLSTPNNLISILTTIIWLASAHHAAVNFGMYPYGGYFPVRPPFMRRLVPNKHDPDYTTFLADPEGYFLASLPCLDQMLHYISVLHILSTHSADEEYLGDRKDLSAWAGDPEIVEAFYKFSMEMKKIGKEIEKRNGDPNLTNRCGAGISPYELLLPSSGPGVTCRGVPN
ncbi:hypothetical protein Gohar_010594, partial [Gossypium harknessii]|nr:hypothetical protein [Gossypium harknessii]